MLRRLRTAAAGAALVVLVVGATPATASRPTGREGNAATTAGSPATVSRAAFGAVPADGTISGGTMTWDDGAVVLKLRSAGTFAFSDCDPGYLCIWDHRDYVGRQGILRPACCSSATPASTT